MNQRSWWVFTPTEIRGGLIYYPGAAVDARAYFPLAFEIAARGHLVVIVQMPCRIASLSYQDANTVIASKHPLFSGKIHRETLPHSHVEFFQFCAVDLCYNSQYTFRFYHIPQTHKFSLWMVDILEKPSVSTS